MNETVAAVPIAAPLPRPRRRWKRGLLVFLMLLIVVPTMVIWYRVLLAEKDWDAAMAEAVESDPRWTLMELETDRPQFADAENAALHIKAVHAKGGGVSVAGAPNYDVIFNKLRPNVQLNGQQIQLLRTQLAKIAGPLAEARKLKDMPQGGRFPVKYSDEYFATLIPDHQNARVVADWLEGDVFDLAQQGLTDEAVESCQALLIAGRVFKDDAFVISLLIRAAMQSMAVQSLERVLAQGEAADAALQAMQAALQRDIDSSGWLAAIRGERAGCHHLFENVRSGKVKDLRLLRSLAVSGRVPATSWRDWIADLFPSTLAHAYPEMLRHMTRCVEIAKLPIHERHAKMQAWGDQTRDSDNAVIRLLAPALEKCHRAECRGQAYLRSALVAVACERFRKKHGDWPGTLDELVQSKLLTAVPLDPMDGQPLRYRLTGDGAVVYSIGNDKVDNQGSIDPQNADAPGNDVGFRLYDPRLRRLAPLPSAAERLR